MAIQGHTTLAGGRYPRDFEEAAGADPRRTAGSGLRVRPAGCARLNYGE